MTKPAVSFSPLPSGSCSVKALASSVSSSQVWGTSMPTFSRQSLRAMMAKACAENGTAQVLPSLAVAAFQATSESLSASAIEALSTSVSQPWVCILPICAVSLITMSGRSRCAACCCSLVSKSSNNATTLVWTPLAWVNASASFCAVLAESESGACLIQISSASSVLVLVPPEPQPVSVTARVVAIATTSRRRDIRPPPVHICDNCPGCGRVPKKVASDTHHGQYSRM